MQPRYGAYNMGISQMAAGLRQPSLITTADGDMPSQTFDFNRMLQQPLSEECSATGYRSTLHNIQELDADELATGENAQTPGASPMRQQRATPSVMSVTTGATRREGPGNASHEHSLIQSLYGPSGVGGAGGAGLGDIGSGIGVHEPMPTDLTTADMCLSTLYLHELFHRQNRRRSGSRSTHQQPASHGPASQWQLPHREAAGAGSAVHPRPTGAFSDQGRPAAEKTPLLNPKRT